MGFRKLKTLVLIALVIFVLIVGTIVIFGSAVSGFDHDDLNSQLTLGPIISYGDSGNNQNLNQNNQQVQPSPNPQPTIFHNIVRTRAS